MLYGGSLLLEFIALVALRIREPQLPRTFRVPGGLAGAILAGVLPTLLLALAVIHGEQERVLGLNGLVFGLLLIGAGFASYYATSPFRRARRETAATKDPAQTCVPP